MQHTKIVCTLGPASSSQETLCAMMEAGLDVARLNFSHGTHSSHADMIQRVRACSEATGRPAAIMQDLQGPRVRVGRIVDGRVELTTGQRFTFTTREVVGAAGVASVTYAGLADDLTPGDRMYIDDDDLVFEVESIDGPDIHARVVAGGFLQDHKGINLPGVDLRIPVITEKDRADLRFGVEKGVDLVAMSFVRCAADVQGLKVFLRELGAGDMPIVAKIERRQALDNLPGIIDAAYAVMVARGDLALETAAKEVPVAQKRIIRACRQTGTPVITATQMLESMTQQPEPTRAEATDVANAVFDGSDALMLSGETAVGRFPVATVRAMAEITERAEQAVRTGEVRALDRLEPLRGDIDDTIAALAVRAAENVDAKAILAFTRSGSTALRLARQRSGAPIVAITPHEGVARRLLMSWAVRPLICPLTQTRDELNEMAVNTARSEGLVSDGDTVVLAAGLPGEAPGHTNLLEINRVE